MSSFIRASFSAFVPIPKSNKSIKSAASKKPNCWRIQNIPEEWPKERLLEYLRVYHPSLQSLEEHWISLYPAPFGNSRTALLNMQAPLEFFQSLDADQTHPITVVYRSATGERTEVDLTTDCHFHGLTPLNNPEGENIIDVIAVTGLSGHAFGSWRNRENYRMWLQDFLPKDIPKDIRILIYGYDSSLIKPGKRGLLEYRRTFIQNLSNARSTLVNKSRPIIFVGHSLGCIVITQALLQSQSNPDDKHVLDSTRTVIFFGAPHAGLKVDSLMAMVDDVTSSNRNSTRLKLLEQLCEDSDFLEDQKERLIHIWAGMRIISFYELKETPTVKRGASGEWERKGDAVQMIRNISALLYLQQESRFAIDENHTNMVKFMIPADKNYQTVLLNIRECINKYAVSQSKKKFEEMLQRSKALNDFLNTLKAFSCQAFRDDLIDLRHGQTCQWFFDCAEYKSWMEQESPGLLWISGDPGSGKSVLLSYVTKTLASSPNRPLVAYFFCDDKRKEQNNAIAILRGLLFQMLSLAPVLYKYIPREYLPDFNSTWSFGSLWNVFETIITKNNESEIICVIDALDECEEDSRNRFLEDLIRFFGKKPNGVRMIITSRPELRSTRELPTSTHISLEKRNSEDIGQFIDFKMARLVRRKNLPIDLKLEIRDVLMSGAGGMFLWVSLTLYRLEHSSGTSASSMREQLKQLPKDIPAIYAKILQEIEDSSREKAKRILEWVNSAVRPLKVGELKIVAALQPTHTSIAIMQDYVENNPEHFFSAIFGPLLKIDRDDTVRFVHQTVKDFLTDFELMIKFDSPPAESLVQEFGVVSVYHLSHGESNLHLAIDCLNFLSSEEFGAEPPEDQLEYYSRIQDYPFLYYAAMQWPFHFKETDSQEDRGLLKAFLKLARAETKMDSAYQIYHDHSSHEVDPVSMLNKKVPFKRTSALQICVLFGFSTLIKALLDHGFDINEQGGIHGSALSAALWNRKETIVKMLLNETTKKVLVTDSMVEYVAEWFNNPEILELLLSKGGRPTESAILAAAGRWNGLEQLQYLLRNGGPVTEAVLLAATRDRNPKETLRFLLSSGGVVTEAILTKAARISKIDKEFLEWMLDHNHKISITEAIIVAAAANSSSPIELVTLLLERGGPVTEATMVAAAENWTKTKELLETMLDRGGQVSEKVLVAVAANKHGIQALELLLAKDDTIPVSEAMLLEAVKHQSTATAHVKLLLNKGGRVTPEVMIAAAGYYARPGLLKVLLSNGGEVTEEVLFAAIGTLDYKALQILINTGIQVTEGLMVAATQNSRITKLLELLINAGGQVTNIVMIKAARSQYGGVSTMELLLSKGGRVTEEVVTAAAANSNNGHDILELLFNLEPSITITERMLIEAARCLDDARSLHILLVRFHGNPVTEAVLVSAARNKSPRKHLELLLGREQGYLRDQITENVMVAAAANQESEKQSLEFLLSTDDNLQLTEEVLVVIAEDPMGRELLSSVLTKGHNIFVTEEILVAAANNKITNGVLDLLLGADETIPITEKILVAAARSPYGSSLIELLLGRGGKVTEAVMIAAAGNAKGPRGLLETLLNNSGSTFLVTEEVLLSASRNKLGKEALEYLFSTDDNIPITEAVVTTALGAQGTSESLELLLSIEPTIPITQAMLLAAAGGGYNSNNVQLLLSKENSLQITDDLLAVGAAGCLKEAFVALLHKAGGTTPITETILVQAVRNKYDINTIEFILNNTNTHLVTSAVLEAAVGNTSYSSHLGLVFSKALTPLKVTETIFVRAAANAGGTNMMKALRKLCGTLTITKVVLVGAAWFAPDMYNLKYLLVRVNKINITETLMIAAALNPKSDRNLQYLLSLGGRITERVMIAAAWNPNTKCLEFLLSQGSEITENVILGAIISPSGEKAHRLLQSRSGQVKKPTSSTISLSLKESIGFFLDTAGHDTKATLLRAARCLQEDGQIWLAFRNIAIEMEIADNESHNSNNYDESQELQDAQCPTLNTAQIRTEIVKVLEESRLEDTVHIPVMNLRQPIQLDTQNTFLVVIPTKVLTDFYDSRVANIQLFNINSPIRLFIIKTFIFLCDLLIVGGIIYGAALYLSQVLTFPPALNT